MSKMTLKDERTRFERRSQGSIMGRRLPTVDDMLRLGPFYMDSLEEDIKAFAARLEIAIKPKSEQAQNLKAVLKSLTVAPWEELVRNALTALRAMPEGSIRKKSREEFERRFLIYLAYMGDMNAIHSVADICFEKGIMERNDAVTVDLLRAFLGWQTALFHRSIWYGHTDWYSSREKVYDNGQNAVRLIGRYWIDKTAAESTPTDIAEVGGENAATACPEGTLVVVGSIGNANANSSIMNEFKGILGVPMPFIPVPDLQSVRKKMSAEFPYALEVVDKLMDELVAQPHVRFRPTILVGTPGCGKTRFWQRLMELLAVPSTVFSCGGVADSAISGTARRYSTGEPCLPLSLVRRHQIANPAIILDEIEKAGDSRTNGNLLDALLAFLEPQSATSYYDQYLQAPVNLSALIWCGTANSAEGWPKPLRDRVRILRFPTPGPEHIEMLSRALLADIAAERAHHAQWLHSLTGEELDALRSVWPGGSVRQLRRYLEGVLAARETGMAKH